MKEGQMYNNRVNEIDHSGGNRHERGNGTNYDPGRKQRGYIGTDPKTA